jgi:hypothetical protein
MQICYLDLLLLKDSGFLLILTKCLPVLHVPVLKIIWLQLCILLYNLFHDVKEIETKEMQNFVKEVVILRSRVMELEQQLQECNITKNFGREESTNQDGVCWYIHCHVENYGF